VGPRPRDIIAHTQTLAAPGADATEKETERFELPGRIDLGDGIEIPPP
jgi:hypothetical protein